VEAAAASLPFSALQAALAITAAAATRIALVFIA
jgi:hypothetical protein